MSKKKYGITDAHYLCDSAIFNTETDEILRLYQICDLLNEQDQKIKELEHRLSNCIEPKFKVGQKLYVIGEKFMGKTLIDEVEYFGENIDGIITFEEGCRCGCTPDRYSVEKIENVFSTKEEAKAKLEELKNGK